MVHEIQVAQYKTVPSSIKLGTFDSYGTEKLHFTFGSGWEDLAVYATFTAPNGKSVQADVDLEGYTDVPAEATAGEAGQGEIVLIGKAEGVNRITVTLHYTVLDHGPVQGDEPAVPTPDLLQQVLTLSKEAQQSAKNAEKSAKNAVKDATDTVKPYKEEAAQAAAGAALSEKSAAESKVAAQNAAEVAAQAGIAAGNAADAAKKAAGTATGAAGSSALNAESAQKSAQNAQQSATDAAESQRAAKANADAAAKSQQSAATNAKTAADAKDAAAGSADNAAAAAAAAGNAAGAAARSQQAAGESEEKAAASEGAAKESEQAAAESARAALESKNAAAKSEENAAASAKKAQDVSDSLPEDYTTAVSEISKLKTDKADKTELETVKQKVESITPDDSTVGEKPWSSKNIVDMLCPPLEESGNPVLCYPVAGYPLGVKAKWEPVQEGEGEPYPAGGGKNLLDISGMESKTEKGITFELKNGGIWIHGTATETVDSPSFDTTHLKPGTYCGWKIDNIIQQFVVYIAEDQKNIWLRFDGAKVEVGENDEPKYYYFIVKAGTTVNAIIYPQICAGSIAPTKYYPYENIRPIKGRDSVTVTRCGENLLNFSVEKRVYGISITTESDGRYHLKGTLDRDGFGCNIGTVHLPAGTYTVKKVSFSTSLNTNAIVITLRRYTANNSTVSWIETTNVSGSRNTGSLDKPADIALSFYGSEESIKEGTVIDTYFELVLVAGTTAPTTYTPYIGATNTLTLPETVYGGEVDAVRGEGQETWKLLTFDATEDWAIANAGDTKQFFYTTKYDFGKIPIKVICSHFHNVVFVGTAIIRIYTSIFTDADAFKSYLAAQYAAGTPVQIAYSAEPVPFTATGAQPLPALAGLNTVLTDADSATVTGRADPIKRIEDLEAAAASQA